MGTWPTTITQEDVNLYARVTADFNAIHVDPEFARQTAFGSTVAHGVISAGLMSRYLVQDLGLHWRIKRFRFKCIAPVRPGDNLSCGAQPSQDTADLGPGEIACDVWCQNQRDEKVTIGRAVVGQEVSA